MRRPYKDPLTGVYNFPGSREEAYGLYSYGGQYDHFWTNALTGAPSDGRSPVMTYVQDSLNPYFNNSTDWFRYAFRTGKVLNANIQASGGGAKAHYLVGVGMYNEEGIQYGTDFTRLNLLSNLNIMPAKNLNIDTRFSMSYEDRSKGVSSGFKSASKFDRIAVDPKKVSSFLPGGGMLEDKMVESLNEMIQGNKNFSLRSSFVINYDILSGLRFSVNGSVNFAMALGDLFTPMAMSEDKLNTSKFEISRNMTVMNENLLTYKKSFNDVHNLDLLLGLSFEKITENYNAGQGRGGANDNIHYIYEGFPEVPSVNTPTEDNILQHTKSDLLEQALVSYFFRVGYNYKQRYLTEFTFRRDGSSVFGDKNKYADFPALALGWAFSEEKFLDWAWWLSYGKLRVSYGRSGETFNHPYRAHGLLLAGGDFLGRPIMNVDNDPRDGGMLNRKLSWVKHDQYDFGLDIDFCDYRIKFKLDYYYRWSTGILSSSKLPNTIYLYENQWQNANDVSNEGIELELVADVLRKQDWSWRMRFNASRNWNRLKNTADGRDVGLPSGIPYHMQGRPLYMMYAFEEGKVFEDESGIPYIYHSDGAKHYLYLDRTEYPFGVGMREIKDMNGDLRTDILDQRYVGTTLPSVHGGFANEIRWKNLDLNILFSYSLGRRIIRMYGMSSLEPGDVAEGKNVYMDISKLHFWEKPGDANIEGIYPELSAHDKTMMQFYPRTTKNIERVNYIKLKQITLGYNFPKSWLNKVRLEKVRMFFTGENMLTFTNYSGPDPETVHLMDGMDNYNYYPLARKMTLGLTVNF